MKSKFITSGIPRAMSCSITPAKLHLHTQKRKEKQAIQQHRLNESTHSRGSLACRSAHTELCYPFEWEGSPAVPLDLRHSHGDEAVKFLLGIETVARARVLSACSARSLPCLGFRNPLYGQHLQPTVWQTHDTCATRGDQNTTCSLHFYSYDFDNMI